MQKILFDLVGTQPSIWSKRHGGGKYGEVLLRRIIDRYLSVSCCYDSRKWLNPDIEELLKQNNIDLYDISRRSIEQIVRDEKISLFYVPALITMDHIHFKGCPVLGTIHDLRPLEKPLDISQVEYKPWNNIYRFFLKFLLKKYDLKKKSRFYEEAFKSANFSFVTISAHSNYAFKCYFPQYKDVDIPVFYSPSTASGLEINEIKYSEKFFLLVSADRFFKNNLRAIKALDRLFDYGYAPNFRVKITGVKSADAFWYKIRNMDRFDFVGFVDETELEQLYHDAYCFIYPALSEGFGYPPLEAMHYGVPVLASPFTAISEVCGGNVIYFNPFSVEEIMNRILQILDESTHKQYSQLARERYEFVTKKQDEDLDRLIDYIYNFHVEGRV